MLSNIGITEFLLIAVVALLIFGPNKLPEIGRALGKTVREFKNTTRGLLGDEGSSSAQEQKAKKEITKPTAAPIEESAAEDVAAEAKASEKAAAEASIAEPLATFDEQVERRRVAAEPAGASAGQMAQASAEQRAAAQPSNPKRLPD